MRPIDAFTLAEEIEALNLTVAGRSARWYDVMNTVEVVRCKDCVHHYDGNAGIHCRNPKGLTEVSEDTWCCYGVEEGRNERQ